jgi:isoleucyl-tRNA synthetase
MRWFGFAPKGYPADFIAEYIAQTRTWFYYMHAMGMLLFKQLSFRSVVSTGTVLARDGSKMSKSKGNYTDPMVVMEQYGADALRLYLMGSVVMQGEDLNFRDEEVREAHNRVLGLLWNSFKFYELYRHQHDSSDTSESPHLLDRWIMSRLNKAVADITVAMDAYDTPRAVKEIRLFVDDYSTWYVRRSRERVKSTNLQDKQHALGTQRKVLLTLAKMMAPVAPFIAEAVYRGVGAPEESVHLCAWPEAGTIEADVLADMERARALASRALEARERAGIRIRQPLGVLKIQAALPAEFKKILAEEINVKEVHEDTALEEELHLDTVLTEELREEGVLRDWARSIQEWRKEKNFTINDRPGLLVTTSTDAALLKRHREVLVEQTNLLSLEIKEAPQGDEPVRIFERL